MITWLLTPEVVAPSPSLKEGKIDDFSESLAEYQSCNSINVNQFLNIIQTVSKQSQTSGDKLLLERCLFMLVVHLKDWSFNLKREHFDQIKKVVLETLRKLQADSAVQKVIEQIEDIAGKGR